MRLIAKKSMLLALACVVLVAAVFPVHGDARDCTPQTINEERVKLYLAEAREPLGKLAPQVYIFAADSERCRLDDGAKICGLPDEPLKSTDLEAIFNYYVKQPVAAALNRQQVHTRKSDWTWRPYVKQPVAAALNPQQAHTRESNWTWHRSVKQQ